MHAYVVIADIDRMENLQTQRKPLARAIGEWLTHHVEANGYFKAGHLEKSLTVLKKSGQLIEAKKRREEYL